MIALEPWSLPALTAPLEEMRRRLRQTRLPTSACAGWSGGVDLAYLHRFIAYLGDEYDWVADSARYREHRYVARGRAAEGLTSPGIHVQFPLGERPGSRPLVLLHGWPSCGFEFVHVVDLLEEQDICPILIDLPGFGFSGSSAMPIGPRAIADRLYTLLNALGLQGVLIHGNDWGSTVACWLAADHPELVRGIHLSMMGLKPLPDKDAQTPSADELAWIRSVQKRLAADAGYREIQSTKPNTAAVGLSDSPAALAAWIVEKFHGWGGAGPSEEPPVAMRDLAGIVTAYWLSENIGSANWIYAAVRAHDDTIAPPGGTGDVPVAMSLFGAGFFAPPPRSWASRVHRIVDYSIHDTGGHYPALTRPSQLAADIVQFCVRRH